MALDLNTAKRLIAQRGVQPPPGADFDAWAMAWLENAVNAGDPAAVQAVGGRQAEEGGGVYADFGGAADPQSWLGQRKPTPRELRKYAQVSGQSEDYNRFDDRQLAAWIDKSWDVGQGGFLNDFGDRVEKPTESGSRSLAAGYATGERSVGMRGGGGGGGGGRAGKAGEQTFSSPLAEMLANQGGFLGQYDPTRGDEQAGVRGGIVKGGGIWYQPTQTTRMQPQEAMGISPVGPATGVVPGGNTVSPAPSQIQPRTIPEIMPTRPGAKTTAIGTPSWTTNTGSLTSMLAPLQGGGITGGPTPSGMAGWGIGTTATPATQAPGTGFSGGWQGPAAQRRRRPGGLSGLMGGLQQQPNAPGRWSL